MHRPVITVVPSTAYPTCFPLTQFTCNNGRCININWRCDNGECLFSASSPSVPVLHLSFMYQCAVHVSPPSLHWHTRCLLSTHVFVCFHSSLSFFRSVSLVLLFCVVVVIIFFIFIFLVLCCTVCPLYCLPLVLSFRKGLC